MDQPILKASQCYVLEKGRCGCDVSGFIKAAKEPRFLLDVDVDVDVDVVIGEGEAEGREAGVETGAEGGAEEATGTTKLAVGWGFGLGRMMDLDLGLGTATGTGNKLASSTGTELIAVTVLFFLARLVDLEGVIVRKAERLVAATGLVVATAGGFMS